MTDSEDRIDDAIRAEERRLLAQIGEEPPFIAQALDLFRARNGWVSSLMMVAQTVLFIAGAWATWRFFGATETLDAIRWGLPAAVLLLMSLIIKLAIWPVMHISRLRQDVERLARWTQLRDG